MEGLLISLENLYTLNDAVCVRQGVSREKCEERIDEIIKRIQGKTREVCKEDQACNLRGLEWHIDHEELDKLKAKLLLIYT